MGVKLKSLRPAVGSYGNVAANGIVEVDESEAGRLRKTGRFVDATAADIEAAQKAQADHIARALTGTGVFAPMPEPPRTAEGAIGFKPDEPEGSAPGQNAAASGTTGSAGDGSEPSTDADTGEAKPDQSDDAARGDDAGAAAAIAAGEKAEPSGEAGKAPGKAGAKPASKTQ